MCFRLRILWVSLSRNSTMTKEVSVCNKVFYHFAYFILAINCPICGHYIVMLAWLKCRLTKAVTRRRERIGDGASQIIIFNFSILMICFGREEKRQVNKVPSSDFYVWTLNNNSDAMRKRIERERERDKKDNDDGDADMTPVSFEFVCVAYVSSWILLSFRIYSNDVLWMQSNEIWFVYLGPFLVNE